MTLNRTLATDFQNQTSYFETVLDILRSLIGSIAAWSSDYQLGWQEFPDDANRARPSVDLWSTSQAVEILCLLFNQFVHSEKSSALVNDTKRVIAHGANLLLINTLEQGGLLSNKSESLLVAQGKPDVIGLVWQLRALSQLLKISPTIQTDIKNELLLKKGEAILKDLFRLQDANGAWSSFGEVGKSTYTTTMVVWSIAESYPVFKGIEYLRPHKVHGTHIAVDWLLKNRIENSGIPFFEGGRIPSVSRTALTSIAIWARRQMKCPEPIPELELARNNAWLIEQQDVSGGWHDLINEKTNPDTEVTSLALLALLKGGVRSNHPGVYKAIRWLVSCRKTEDSIHGWGIYDKDSKIRIWTTWYACLALCEFVLRSPAPVEQLDYKIVRKPRLTFAFQESPKEVRVRLAITGQNHAWVHLRVKEKDAGFKLIEPSLCRLQKETHDIRFAIFPTRTGLIKGSISLSDITTGKLLDISLNILAPGHLFKTLMATLGTPRDVLASLAAASTIYLFFKYGNHIDKTLISDVLFVVAGTLFIVFIFACIKYLSGER